MFCPTSYQSSVFEVDSCFPEALPRSDWCYTYRDRILPLIDEEKFKHLYSESEGRPNASIKKMVSLLIFMGMEKLTWRAVEFQFPRRLDWLIATGTEIGKGRIDHTTLFYFYQRLESDDTARELFAGLTDEFIKSCGASLKKQRTDSFFIHGWLKLLSRYGLLTETARKFLQVLRKQKPGLYKIIAGELSINYLDRECDLAKHDKKHAQKQICLVVKDLYRIITAFENHRQITRYETFNILCRVFTEHCEVKVHTDEGEPEIVIKEKPDSGSVCSPHNTDVRCARKDNQLITGDKAFVTETCVPENKTQFITDADVVTSTEHDSQQQSEIQKRLLKNGFKPDNQYGDAGFVNGKTLLESRSNGIELEGPLAGHSQSLTDYDPQSRPLDAGDFDVTIENRTGEFTVNRCPNNRIPKDQKRSKKTGKMIVHFDPVICTSCTYAHRCPVRIGKRNSTLSIDEKDYAGAVRYHTFMENEEYRKECRIRIGIEATVSELTRAHGTRKSRHRKQSRTRLQLIFAAIACNVKRFIRHGEFYGYLEPQLS